MAKVFITGASGFVGSWLVRTCADRGLDVYAGVRKTSDTSLIDDVLHIPITYSFEDQAALRTLLRSHDFDYIIHVAGITRAPVDEQYFKINSNYSAMLAKLSLEECPSLKKFVYISSVEAYGSADNTRDQIVTHSSTPSPRTLYGQSKLHAEQALSHISGLPLITIRPTAVFGPGERDIFAIWRTIKHFKCAPVLGDPDIVYSFIYVKDLARVTLDACLSPKVGKAYFVTDGQLYQIKDFTDPIAASLGIRPLRFTIPFGVLEGIVSVTKVYDRVTGSKSLLNDEQLAKMKARRWAFDISDLRADFSFVPEYKLDQALQETTRWYLSQGWL